MFLPSLAEKTKSSGEPSVFLSDTKCLRLCQTPKITQILLFLAKQGQTPSSCFPFLSNMEKNSFYFTLVWN